MSLRGRSAHPARSRVAWTSASFTEVDGGDADPAELVEEGHPLQADEPGRHAGRQPSQLIQLGRRQEPEFPGACYLLYGLGVCAYAPPCSSRGSTNTSHLPGHTLRRRCERLAFSTVHFRSRSAILWATILGS